MNIDFLNFGPGQPRAREFSELTKRKLRRKQNPVAVFNSPQQSINDLTIDKPKRKKIAVIIPNVLLTSTSTTTPRPASQSIITTDGALNRTEDDPRCKKSLIIQFNFNFNFVIF